MSLSASAATAAITRQYHRAIPRPRSLSPQCLRITSTCTSTQSRFRQTRRWQSTDTAAAAAAAPTNPKIVGIVDQISQLTLLETADLVASLKSRLNIPDLSFAAPASGPSASAAPAAPAEEEEPTPPPQEKSLFTLRLESFEAAAKSKIIKEVKGLLGLSLIDSKKFVESVPKVMKEGVTKEEGGKIVETIKALGGVVKME